MKHRSKHTHKGLILGVKIVHTIFIMLDIQIKITENFQGFFLVMIMLFFKCRLLSPVKKTCFSLTVNILLK